MTFDSRTLQAFSPRPKGFAKVLALGLGLGLSLGFTSLALGEDKPPHQSPQHGPQNQSTQTGTATLKPHGQEPQDHLGEVVGKGAKKLEPSSTPFHDATTNIGLPSTGDSSKDGPPHRDRQKPK